MFESNIEIDKICKKYNIKNYTIKGDGSIDVDGYVDIVSESELGLDKIPLKFGKVSGYFNCYDFNLLSLEGCPHTVGDGFYCGGNQLTSLQGSPKSLGGDFHLCG